MVEAPEREDSLFELKMPPEGTSVTKARRAAAEVARSVGASETDVKIAVSEAVGNAVLHAYRDGAPGTITLSAQRDADRLIITVADDGDGMRPHLDSPGLGLGISLITKVTGEVRFDSSERGTTVSMCFDLPPREAR